MLSCAELLERVEAIAAGDLEVDEPARTHLETCPGCASALASARRVEALLASRPAPPAPDQFAAMVAQRVRRERWRAEQQVDWVFNAAIAVGLVVVVGGVAALLNLAGLVANAGAAWSMLANFGGELFRQAVPTVATYVAAAALLVSTLVIWWWADRRLSL